jgi:hypothetical protein
VREDVVDSLPDGRDLLSVLVRDLDPELVLELHDQLDQIQRVGVEVFLERSLVSDLVLVDAELLDENGLHLLGDFFSRRCHVTSFSGLDRGTEAGRSYTSDTHLRPVFRPCSAAVRRAVR